MRALPPRLHVAAVLDKNSLPFQSQIMSELFKNMLCDSRTAVFALLFSATALHAADLPKEIRLWPRDAPGSEGKTGSESVRITTNGDHVISSIHQPSITPFLPALDKATGCAVIIAPGGGHRELWIEHEGYNVAERLSKNGVAAFVLKYRLAKEANSTYSIDGDELADMQRAIRLVRSRAPQWNINPDRVGVMGFSAGGEVAALAAMRFDQTVTNAIDSVDNWTARPNFQALIYPGHSARIEPSTNSPPAFLACGYKDRTDISEGLATVYLKFKQVKVPAELHIYSGTGHGFGLRSNDTQPAGQWIERFEEWLKDSGFLKNCNCD
jgi:acetyl esterase/lipase